MKPNKIEINVTKNMENTEFRHNTTGFSHQNLRNTKKFVPKLTENCEFRHKMTAPPEETGNDSNTDNKNLS